MVRKIDLRGVASAELQNWLCKRVDSKSWHGAVDPS